MIPLLACLACLGLARIAELLVSKRNWQYHKIDADMPRETLFPWMVALHSSVFVLLPLEYHFLGGAFAKWSYLALALTLAAFCLRFWTLKTIGKSWNVRVVGGPQYPIVDGGPYRYIRHPNYLVVCLELAFIPLIWQLWRSSLVLSLLNALILFRRIRTEEALLRQNPGWMARMSFKPRFLPRLSRNQHPKR